MSIFCKTQNLISTHRQILSRLTKTRSLTTNELRTFISPSYHRLCDNLKQNLNKSNSYRCIHSSPKYQNPDKTEKIKVSIKTEDDCITLEGKKGDSILDLIVDNEYEILGYGACEGTIACSTCHCIMKQKDYDNHCKGQGEEEKDLLDMISHIKQDTGQNLFGGSLSLAGAGFLAPYLVGAMSALCEVLSPSPISRSPLLTREQLVLKLLSRDHLVLARHFDHFCGASAGALLATLLLSPTPSLTSVWDLFMKTSMDCSQYIQGPFHKNIVMEHYIRSVLRELPRDIHEVVSGRLFVSITRLKDSKNLVVSEWSSKEDLICCLLCSCYIPVFSGGAPPLFRGERYIDGGFTDNQPLPPGRGATSCLRISPFASTSDICPPSPVRGPALTVANERYYITPSNLRRLYHALMPATQHQMMEYFFSGFKDSLLYLQKSS